MPFDSVLEDPGSDHVEEEALGETFAEAIAASLGEVIEEHDEDDHLADSCEAVHE
jgi:hypothetical protein